MASIIHKYIHMYVYYRCILPSYVPVQVGLATCTWQVVLYYTPTALVVTPGDSEEVTVGINDDYCTYMTR